ncbi:hypothetical protein BV22DRAFT_982617, partial [Leucogyrophana mollusca]
LQSIHDYTSTLVEQRQVEREFIRLKAKRSRIEHDLFQTHLHTADIRLEQARRDHSDVVRVME